MPRQVIGYEGEGRARRPIYRDEVIDPSPLAGLPVGSPEAAAAIARVGSRTSDRPVALQITRPPMGSPEHLAQSRRNGAARASAVYAARRATTAPQEVPMSLPALPDTVELDPLEHLAQVAAEAARARQAKVAADEAWDIARETLATAYARLSPFVTLTAHISEPVEPVAPMAQEAAASVALDEHPEAAHTVKPAPAPPKRQPGRHPGKAQGAQEKAERARRVMEAMARLGDDQRAVAAELGMRVNAVAMVVKYARARGEA